MPCSTPFLTSLSIRGAYPAKMPWWTTNLKLLTAIVESILWSEESYTRFLQCGFDAAIELFDISSQNWEFEESMSSRHNPRNWDKYKQLQKRLLSLNTEENRDLKYSPSWSDSIQR
ncbi:hypothetical protein [Komarekiella delphini-convector]|uniref:hypothetical protein n=1 Tax=Komarekiella delphini-convector TaxID=3050158 RepID=UPI001CD84CF0|nr:hypothetical protein [Komarekiella delphini-convector]